VSAHFGKQKFDGPKTAGTLVIAHRGASAHRPENTVEAFALAAELGADGVELDVHALADGRLVVVHDAPDPAVPLPASVPTLAEALEACGPLAVNVEIKAAPVGAVAEVVRAWGGEVLVSSFDHAVVDEAVALGLPSAQLTFLRDRPVEETVAWLVRRGLRWWHPHAGTLTEVEVAAAHGAGLGVNTWTVDDPGRVAELASWGVEGIVTNDVPAARSALGR
jgi:glycerophosphoryl diester phosphodiesterase